MIVGEYVLFISHEKLDEPKKVGWSGTHSCTHETRVEVYDKADFEKAESMAELRKETSPLASARAQCSTSDQFSRRKGVLIASNRALKDLDMEILHGGSDWKIRKRRDKKALRNARRALQAAKSESQEKAEA